MMSRKWNSSGAKLKMPILLLRLSVQELKSFTKFFANWGQLRQFQLHLNATGSEWHYNIEEITYYKESEQFCKIFEMLGSVFKCAQDQAHLWALRTEQLCPISIWITTVKTDFEMALSQASRITIIWRGPSANNISSNYNSANNNSHRNSWFSNNSNANQPKQWKFKPKQSKHRSLIT